MSEADTSPIEHCIDVNGDTLVAFEWGREHRGATESVVLTHATGFHARVWDDAVARLDRRHVVAVDQRGHGRSHKKPFTNWRDFGDDLVAILRALDVGGAVGVGHSMGGHSTVLAAAAAPDLFSSLLLIDPVILPPEYYGGSEPIPGRRGAADHPTARRRARFASPQAMIERFAAREPFSLFTERALSDYCTYGLLPADDGDGFVLACPPAYEASIYMSARSNPDVYETVARVAAPVTVVRAMEPRSAEDFGNFAFSPTWPGLAASFAHGRDVHLSDHTHFIPMQDPALTARLIAGGR